MILSHLKTQTHELHEQTERAVDLRNRLHSATAYLELLSRLWGFYSPIEERLAAIDRAHDLGVDLDSRRKAPLLLTDLSAIDSAGSQPPICGSLPAIAGPAEAFGCLYVLEGATLGGQFIRREVQAKLGFDEHRGGSFFAGYGERTGTMWRMFGEAITAFADAQPESRDVIIASASATFLRFKEWVA